MKYSYLLLFLLLITGKLMQAQHLPTANADTLITLLNRAMLENKLVFIRYERSYDAIKPFASELSKSLQTRLEKQYVVAALPINADNMENWLNNFHVNGMAYVVIDQSGYPLARRDTLFADDNEAISFMDSVGRIAATHTMGYRLSQYNKGVRSRTLLKELLNDYRNFGMYTDQRILSDYLSMLNVRELDNFETVCFLHAAGPVVGSKNYRLIETNAYLVDSLFNSLPLKERLAINQHIIINSFREALINKDEHQAGLVGNFVANTWNGHLLRRRFAWEGYQTEYARLMADTTNYVQYARSLFNWFDMELPIDSLAKMDYLASKQGTPQKQAIATIDSVENSQFSKWLTIHRMRYERESAIRLHGAARQFLLFDIRDEHALLDAIRWQQRAIAWWPGVSRYHATLADLFDRLGFQEEAASERKRAMEIKK